MKKNPWYEQFRSARYNGISIVEHSEEAFLKAYLAWKDTEGRREFEWDEYCDIRDNVPLGTNKEYRLKKKPLTN